MADLYAPDRARLHHKQAKQCISIIWKRLVLPVLQARLAGKPLRHVTCSSHTLDQDLQKVLKVKEKRECVKVMFKRYDYIRLIHNKQYTAGTRLWREVDARRMMQELGDHPDQQCHP